MQQGEGLYNKYEVYKTDECRCCRSAQRGVFVLKPREDPIAREALATYALQTPDDQLRDDLFGWLWDIRNVPEG